MVMKDQDPDLEFFLMQGDSVMGARGTLASTVNQLLSGGHGGGNLGEDGMYVHPYTDQQLGTGRCMSGEVERVRWLGRAWFACSEETRGLLLLAHQAPPGEYRSDSGYGARDRWVEGSDSREGQDQPTRTGVDSELGTPVLGIKNFGVSFGVAALAIALAPDQAKLLIACHNPKPLHTSGKRKGAINIEESKRRQVLIKEAKRRAQDALRPAWAEWFAKKSAADPMRTNTQRNPNWQTVPETKHQHRDELLAELRRLLPRMSGVTT